MSRSMSTERKYRGLVEALPATGFILDDDGRVLDLFADNTGVEALGVDPDRLVGRTVFDVFPEATAERFVETIQRAIETNVVQTLHYGVSDEQGPRRFEAYVAPVPGCDPPGVALIAEDVTDSAFDRERHETHLDALDDASRRFWQAEDERTIGTVVVDVAETVLDGHLVTMWSYDEQADELVPQAAADADGTTTLEDDGLLDGALDSITHGTAEMCHFRAGESVVIEDYRTVDAPAHPSLSLRTLLLVPLGEHGLLHVASETTRSIDDRTRKVIDILGKNAEAALERQAREQALERSRALLERTERLADVGGWQLDLHTNEQTWTDGTRRIHQVSDTFDPTLESGIEFYHPNDRDRIRTAVKRCRTSGEPYDLEARLVTATGRERWIEATGRRSDHGENARLEGAIRDITRQKEREQQLSVLYRILRHNLRNDINVVQGFAASIDRQLAQLDIPNEIDGREVEALDRLVDRLGELDDPDLQRDIDALERALANLSEARIDTVRTYEDRIEAALDKLMSIGNKASQLHDLITGEGSDEAWCRLESAVSTMVDDLNDDYPDARIDASRVVSVRVAGAADVLALALKELAENAVCHADSEAPTVEISAERDDDGNVDIEVADQGPGIPSDELEALRRGEEEALVHSSGLGLWLVNWLATHLDGHLTFESNDPRGTVARLTIPTAADVGVTGSEADA